MTSYRPVDSKREEFRKYLEKAGAMDALTKVLVMLYDEPEKPADALDYIRKHLGDNSRPDDAEINVLKAELEDARLQITNLEAEVKYFKERLAQYEPPEEGNQGTLMEVEEELEGERPKTLSDSKTVNEATKTVTGAKTVNEAKTVTGTKTVNETKTVTGAKTVNETKTVTGAKTITETEHTPLEGAETVAEQSAGNVSGVASQPGA